MLALDIRIAAIKQHSVEKLCAAGIADERLNRTVDVVRRIIVRDRKLPRHKDDLVHSMYNRPMEPNAWSSLFDEQTSPVNQPLDKALFEKMNEKVQIKHHWCIGYLIALALIEIFESLNRAHANDVPGLKLLHGEDAPDDPGGNFIAEEQERSILAEGMLGKAEEAVFKADAYWGSAQHGIRGATPEDERWKSEAASALRRYGLTFVNRFYDRNGKLNKSGLCDALKTRYEAETQKKLLSVRRMTPYIEAVINQAGFGRRPPSSKQ